MAHPTIPRLTKDCPRGDCRISIGASYLSGSVLTTTQLYDRNGVVVPSPPLITTSTFGCATCGAKWIVEICNDKETITREDQAVEPTP